MKVTEKDGHVTVECGDESVTIVGHVAKSPSSGDESGGEESLPETGFGGVGGTDIFSIHLSLPTTRELTVEAQEQIAPLVRKMAETKGFQQLVKAGGRKPMVMVINPGAATDIGRAKESFGAVHQQFKLK